MARIKNTSTKTISSSKKAMVMKKLNSAAAKAKAIMMQRGKSADGLVHTGKLKVPFKAASLAAAKKGLVKQLKRRWRSGTVAKREIRKLSRTTNLLFPKAPFQRLVREIAQDYKDVRFTEKSMQAIQEAAEIFVTETFHKADMARKHANRVTLHRNDVRFSRFMTQESMWIMPEHIWDVDTFESSRELTGAPPPSKKGKKDPEDKKAAPASLKIRIPAAQAQPAAKEQQDALPKPSQAEKKKSKTAPSTQDDAKEDAKVSDAEEEEEEAEES